MPNLRTVRQMFSVLSQLASDDVLAEPRIGYIFSFALLKPNFLFSYPYKHGRGK